MQDMLNASTSAPMRFVSVESRGCGESEDRGPFGIEQFAADVVAIFARAMNARCAMSAISCCVLSHGSVGARSNWKAPWKAVESGE